jgi:hypothetical protein
MSALHARLRRRGWALGGAGVGLALGAQGLFAALEPALPAGARLPAQLAALVVFGTGLTAVALGWQIAAAHAPLPPPSPDGVFAPPRAEEAGPVPRGEVEVVLVDGALWVGSTEGARVSGARVVQVEDRGDHVLLRLDAAPGVVALPVAAAALTDALPPHVAVVRAGGPASVVGRLAAAVGAEWVALLATWAVVTAGVGVVLWLLAAAVARLVR